MSSTGRINTLNPATGQALRTYITFSPEQIEKAVARGVEAQAAWAARGIEARTAVLRRVAEVLRHDAESLAHLAATEMGKPLAEAGAEVEKCAITCDYYAESAADHLADTYVRTQADRSFVTYEPIGVVLAVMPWNFPFWQVFRFAAPALAAGNAALLKHSPNVTGCALAIERVLRDAGLEESIFQTLVIAESDVPSAVAGLAGDPRIAAVTLTGSERAGAALGAAAGTALKKAVLELGGSDPFVVLDDADVDAVVAQAVRARFGNSGQSCIAAKRFIVDRHLQPRFEQAFADAVSALRVGDPLNPDTEVGPLARADLVDALEAQVRASVSAGATVRTGGSRLDRAGAYFAPTVLTDVHPDMPVWRQETFGPVAAVVTVDGEDDAVAAANDTAYGLGASVWTADPDRGVAFGRRVRSGAFFVNAVVASDPRLPFGGIRRSGYGRELGAHGIREFTSVRTFWVSDEIHAPIGAPVE